MKNQKQKQNQNIEKFQGNFADVNGGCTIFHTKTIQSIKNITQLAIYTYLCSRPTEWVINTKEIQTHFDIGRDKTRKAIADLVAIGLLTKLQKRTETGKYTKNIHEYKLHLSPKPENLKPENQALGEKPDKTWVKPVDNPQNHDEKTLNLKKKLQKKPKNLKPENQEPENQGLIKHRKLLKKREIKKGTLTKSQSNTKPPTIFEQQEYAAGKTEYKWVERWISE